MNDNNLIGNSKVTLDFLGNEWHYECIGCAIAREDIKIPGGPIYNGEFLILGADPEVPIPGFLVITFKRHINSFSQTTKEERKEIGNVILFAEKALKELNITNEITLVQEERSKHFHIWIFPNYPWMIEKFGKGVSYLRDISSYAQDNIIEDKIKEVLAVIKKVKEYFDNYYINE